MSIRLPFNIEHRSHQEISFEESIALNFAQLIDRMNPDETLMKMTQILWPVIFIQAEPNFKLMIDKVGVSKLNMNINNAPKTAQIGHVLRNSKMDNFAKLETVKNIIEFKERIFLENELDTESDNNHSEEILSQEINGLFDPDLLKGIGKIVPKLTNFNANDFSCLENIYTFDDSINFGQEWIETLRMVRGIRDRWKSLKDMIEKPMSRWKVDLLVQKKDIQEIYQSKLDKAHQIDETDIQKTLDKAKDNVDVWILQEQKNIIEKIGKMFKGIDLVFEDIHKRNSYFLQTDILKAKNSVGTVVVKAYQNVAHIRTALEESETQLDNISSKINKIRKDLENTNLSAEERIHLLNSELIDRQQNQKNKLQVLKNERNQKIEEIQTTLDNLSNIFLEITNIIDDKIKRCKFDEIKLRNWQIDDNITHLTNPTMNIYVPIGIAIFEDEEEDERIEIIFPSEYTFSNLERIPLTPEYIAFEKEVSKILDINMQLRSNFEFCCERAPVYKNEIKKGFDMLEKKGTLNSSKKEHYLQFLLNLT
ncbi:hypothetical protein [Candidatus Lokiarchaeum ossiferum]|uniref:hypothetical protein n=1 Tax=Candidatus Lokiarchaeum ossiferum TaxID=2951803 RepID=UPI00352D37DC